MSTQIDLGPVLSVPKGDWNASTTYERLNLVRHNSASWICNVATSTGVEPTEDSTDWYLQVKDTSSVTSVNGMKGDVVLTEAETPPANDDSNRIATTGWVVDKLGDVDLSGIKDDTVLAAQNAGSLETGTGELTSAELAVAIENEVAKCLPLAGGTMTGPINSIQNKSPAIRFYDGNNVGGTLYLFSSQHKTNAGGFLLRAFDADNSTYRDLESMKDGGLRWNNKRLVMGPSNHDVNFGWSDVNTLTLNIDGIDLGYLLRNLGFDALTTVSHSDNPFTWQPVKTYWSTSGSRTIIRMASGFSIQAGWQDASLGVSGTINYTQAFAATPALVVNISNQSVNHGWVVKAGTHNSVGFTYIWDYFSSKSGTCRLNWLAMGPIQ